MAAATADRGAKFQPGAVYQFGLDGGATRNVHKGTMICADTDGYAIVGADTAGYRFLGVATERVEQTATSTDATEKIKLARRGLFSFAIGSAALTDIGRPVWLTDDQTVTFTQSNVGPVGKIVERVSSTEVIVDIGDALGGGMQFLSCSVGTSAFASGSTTKEVTTGLTALLAGFVTNQASDSPSKVMSCDNTVTSSAVTCARESSGTAEINFNYLFAGY